MNSKVTYINDAINITSSDGKKYMEIVSHSDVGTYVHVHHIVPVAFYKNVLGITTCRKPSSPDMIASNLVSLSPGRHLLAHYYLMKCAKPCIKSSMIRAFQVIYDATDITLISEEQVLSKVAELDAAYNDISVKVCQYTIYGELVAEYNGLQSAADAVGTDSHQISATCRNKQPTAHGFVWAYATADYNTLHFPGIHGNRVNRKIKQYSLDGVLIKEYPSVVDTAKAMHCSVDCIKMHLLGHSITSQGYIFAYADTDISTINFPGIEYAVHVCEEQPVNQYSKFGKFIKQWPSGTKAANTLHCNQSAISRACREQWMKCNGFYWRYAKSANDTGDITISNLNQHAQRNVGVVQYKLDGTVVRVYASNEDAAHAIHCSSSTMRQSCKAISDGKKCPTIHNYVFAYETTNPETIKFPGSDYKPQSTQKREIAQLTKFGELVAIYESSQDAGRKTKINPAHINACARGTRNSAGGYKWKYADAA